MEKQFISYNEDDTAKLAEQMALVSRIGDIFALEGTLGAGKSVFARAFIQKLTDATEVPSPTFTLVQTYLSPKGEIYHYDLYRLAKPEDIFELNIEEAFHNAVNLIEWPEKMGVYTPRRIWHIRMNIENDKRLITIISPDNDERLLNVKL